MVTDYSPLPLVLRVIRFVSSSYDPSCVRRFPSRCVDLAAGAMCSASSFMVLYFSAFSLEIIWWDLIGEATPPREQHNGTERMVPSRSEELCARFRTDFWFIFRENIRIRR